MGQFDIITYVVQLFWVLVIFAVCYYFFIKYIISVLYSNLKVRKLFEDNLQYNIFNLIQCITVVILDNLHFYKSIIEEIEGLSLILLVWDDLNSFLLKNTVLYSILVEELIDIKKASVFTYILNQIFDQQNI